MSALRPCVSCKRHVRVAAISCPFCNASLPRGGDRYSIPGAFTRAAVFAAALAGCSDHQQPPAPASGSAVQSDDDLEKLLDYQPRTADHPIHDAAPIDAPVQVAEPVDAAMPVDAGVDQQALLKKKREQERLRRIEQQRRQQEERLRVQDHQIEAMPYGAPPARRRVV